MTMVNPAALRPATPSAYRGLVVGDVLRHASSTQPGRTAVSTSTGVLTWGQLADQSSRLAQALLASGARRVGVLLPNCAEFVVAMYGVALAGGQIVPINTRLTASEVDHALSHADCEVLIAHNSLASMWAGARAVGVREVWSVGGGEDAKDLDEVLAASESHLPDVEVDEDDIYWMPFTSGTTGKPKCSLVTHRALVAHWNAVAREFGITAADRVLVPGPFYHSMGFLFGLATLFVNGRVLIQPKFETEAIARALAEERITVLPMVPTMYAMLLESLDTTSLDASGLRLRTLISAGSPLPTQTKERLLDLFPAAGLFEFYGSTEIGIASVLRPEDQRRKQRCAGQPILGAELRLVAEDGSVVTAPDQIGEVHKRGLLLGSVYHKDDSEVAGWAPSGDLATFDAEGYLYIVDRQKDMIVSGGANVYPAEVEAVLAEHPAVREVAVFGTADATWGEAVTAAVVLGERTAASAQELLAFCRERLAGYKCPKRVELVDELPKNGAGKVLKRVLRQAYAS